MRRGGGRVPLLAHAGEGFLSTAFDTARETTDCTTVERLAVENFRNLVALEFAPSAGLTVVRGPNGVGKTSLLEALAYCSSLRSFRRVPRDAVIRSGVNEARIRCELHYGHRQVEIDVSLIAGQRDKAFRNGQRADGAHDLLEVLRTTLFTPDDLEIVKGSPELRRDLLDDIIASTRPRLAAERANLDRILRQRNALLRQLGGRLTGEVSHTLAVWDERLTVTGERVAAGREELTREIGPLAAEAFAGLAPRAGPLTLRYVRSFAGPLADAIVRARDDDLRRQMTTVGPQRDDLELVAGGLDARTRLSQGRQRCVALSLRLAAHSHVTRVTNVAPVLLLDDAFSELDPVTSRALVSELPKGQAILTTAGDVPPGSHPDLVVELVDGRIE